MSKIIRTSLDKYQSWRAPDVKKKQLKDKIPSASSSTGDTIDQAKQQGYELGYQQALMAHESNLQKKISILKTMIKKLELPLAQLDASLQKQLAQFAMTVAKRIIGREIEQDTAHAERMIQDLLRGMQGVKKQVGFRVHPVDAVWLNDAFRRHANAEGLHVVEDASIPAGECRLDTDSNQMDVSIKARLAYLAAKLMHEQGTDDENL